MSENEYTEQSRRGWWVTARIVEPRLGEYVGRAPEHPDRRRAPFALGMPVGPRPPRTTEEVDAELSVGTIRVRARTGGNRS